MYYYILQKKYYWTTAEEPGVKGCWQAKAAEWYKDMISVLRRREKGPNMLVKKHGLELSSIGRTLLSFNDLRLIRETVVVL